MKKVFFMHVPKCGGTSIKKSLSEAYSGKRIFNIDAHASKYVVDSIDEDESLHAFRDKLILYAMATGRYNLIMGHSVFNPLFVKDFGLEYELISLIRDPVSRFLSHYFYNRYKESSHFKIDDDFKWFLESKAAIELGNFYMKYFSGISGRWNLDKAIENTKFYKIIGILEDLEGFSKNIRSAIGIHLEFKHENISPISKDQKFKEIENSELELIQYICRDDIALYNHIVSNI